jgi:hypothetical protein
MSFDPVRFAAFSILNLIKPTYLADDLMSDAAHTFDISRKLLDRGVG